MKNQQEAYHQKYQNMSNESLEKLAGQNGADPFAMYALATRYAKKRQKPNEVFRLYLESAEQGVTAALNDLGLCYAFGRGVEMDQKRAVEMYEEAAEQGYAPAQHNLGNCHFLGKGVEKDETRAVKFYQESAGQGYAPAQYALGFCYAFGKGVEQNKGFAVALYKMAAQQGYARAQKDLGDYYYKNGLTRGEEKSCAYYLLAKINDPEGSSGQSAQAQINESPVLSVISRNFNEESQKSGKTLKAYLERIAGLTPKSAEKNSAAVFSYAN